MRESLLASQFCSHLPKDHGDGVIHGHPFLHEPSGDRLVSAPSRIEREQRCPVQQRAEKMRGTRMNAPGMQQGQSIIRCDMKIVGMYHRPMKEGTVIVNNPLRLPRRT